MITSTPILLGVILVFWIAWVAVAITARRSWLPIAVTIPWAMLVVGLLLNYVYDWSGTITVMVLHLLIAGNMVRNAMKHPRGEG